MSFLVCLGRTILSVVPPSFITNIHLLCSLIPVTKDYVDAYYNINFLYYFGAKLQDAFYNSHKRFAPTIFSLNCAYCILFLFKADILFEYEAYYKVIFRKCQLLIFIIYLASLLISSVVLYAFLKTLQLLLLIPLIQLQIQ